MQNLFLRSYTYLLRSVGCRHRGASGPVSPGYGRHVIRAQQLDGFEGGGDQGGGGVLGGRRNEKERGTCIIKICILHFKMCETLFYFA